MKKQYFLLVFSIILIIVGLTKSISYATIKGTYGAGFEFGIVLNWKIIFGLVGMGAFYAVLLQDKRRE